MKQWDELSDCALEAMSTLGGFGPTANAKNREVKGNMLASYGDDTRTYFGSGELRELAEGLNEVAAWLDQRADADAQEGGAA